MNLLAIRAGQDRLGCHPRLFFYLRKSAKSADKFLPVLEEYDPGDGFRPDSEDKARLLKAAAP
jgi:hypothetical protein